MRTGKADNDIPRVHYWGRGNKDWIRSGQNGLRTTYPGTYPALECRCFDPCLLESIQPNAAFYWFGRFGNDDTRIR